MLKPILCTFLIFITSCGGSVAGGTEFGNPTRVVMGSFVAAETCPADTAIATDSEAQTTTAAFAADCSFELNLAEDTAYTLSFYAGEDFVATLQVEDAAGKERSPVFIVSDQDSPLDLGDITISDDDAIPENEPAEQNDQDDDGITDFDDKDDDADGTPDTSETDCDNDGFSDDDDAVDSCDAA